MYWLGLTELTPDVEVKAVARVEINEVKSDGDDPSPDDPPLTNPVDPVDPEPEMLNPEEDELEEEPEMGAHAKLIVLGTPS